MSIACKTTFCKLSYFRTLLQNNTIKRGASLSFTTSSARADIDKFTPKKTDLTSILPKDDGEEFRYLLRHSALINFGDPEDKVVRGKVFQVIGDDLYIDFGWKFYCVCPRPHKNGSMYVRGAGVLLKVKALELSSKFLGSEKDLTLLEADGTILGLLHSPAAKKNE